MSKTPSAILAYGYALGDNEDGWNVKETNQDGIWLPHWLHPDDHDNDGYGIDHEGEAWAYLLISTGRVVTVHPPVSATVVQQEAHHERVREAREELGVRFIRHGYEHGYGLALVTWSTEVDYSEVGRLDLSELIVRRQAEDWDYSLRSACDTLRITPIAPPSDGQRHTPRTERTPIHIRPSFLLLARYF